MTSPTNDYLKNSDLADKISKEVAPDLQMRWEGSTDDHLPSMCVLPTRIDFYKDSKKIGELYFVHEPMKVISIDDSFKPYEQKFRNKLKI